MFSQFGLYLVMTDPVVGYEECARAAAGEGAYIIQLNMGDAPTDGILHTAERVRNAISDSDSLLVIRSNIDVAREIDAHGIHLGPDDMSLSEAREMWNKADKIFGTHVRGKVFEKAGDSPEPDYLFAGPVFSNPPGEKYPSLLSIADIENILDLSQIPVVAFGGITTANIRDLLDTGAVNYTVEAAVCQSKDPAKMVRKFREIEEEYLGW